MKFKIDNNGTMKIRGTEAEEAIKKAGYNKDRKVQYSMFATISMKTEKKDKRFFALPVYLRSN